jgi:hypothetical protein
MQRELSDIPDQRHFARLRRNRFYSRTISDYLANHEVRRLLGDSSPGARILRLARLNVNLQSHQTNVLDLGG